LLTAVVGWRTAVFSLNVIPLLLIIGTLIFFKKNPPNLASSQPTLNYTHEIKTVFSNKNNWLIGIYAMLLWTPFYTFASLWGIPFLREELGINVTDASKLIAIAWIGSGVGSILIGMLSSYLQKRKICMILSSLLGIAIFPFLILFHIHDLTLLSGILFLFGIASAGQALSFTLIDDNNKKSVLGTASGFNNTVIMIGPMLSDPIVGGLMKLSWDGTMRDGIPFYSLANYQLAFMIIPILFSASLIVCLFYREKMQVPLISDSDTLSSKELTHEYEPA
jgi:predicted MFS family arabinose efflux permease